MLRYCGVMVQVMRARGSPACTASQTAFRMRPFSARPSRSKSRRMKLITARLEPPLISVAWMKPSRSWVTSGCMVDCGKADRMRAASVIALTILP